jgi:4-amino-4-deoxy-L-arabinose transferase-like glycosyltransferase
LLGRLIQAVLVGILHPYLVFLIGRRVFEERVGLIAAALTAVYTYFIYYAGALMTEPFYILGILASLYLAIKIVDTLTEKHDQRFNKRLVLLCFGFGFFLGATALLRQLFLLVIPFIFLWVWWASGKRLSRVTLLGLATTGLIILLMVVPFTAYNYARFNRFVLLNTNSGFAFFWGNHPIYGTHFEPILPAEMGTYQDLIPNELRHLDEAALDNALLQRGIKFITDDPRRYVLLSLSRIPPYFMFWPSKDSGLISNLSRVGGFGLFLPFMIYGLVRAFIPKPPSSKMTLSSPGFLLILFGLVYAAIHILTWTLIRYRLPIDAVMLIFAALAFFDIAQRLGLLKEPQIGGQQI